MGTLIRTTYSYHGGLIVRVYETSSERVKFPRKPRKMVSRTRTAFVERMPK